VYNLQGKAIMAIQIFTYRDIKNLIITPEKTKFIYNGIKYQTFPAKNDSTLLVKSFELGTTAIKLTSFLYSIEKDLGIVHEPKPQTPKNAPTPDKIDPLAYTSKLSEPKELSSQFLETMQLSNIFSDEYKAHKNISIYDNKHEVLYFNHKELLNLRYKYNGKNKLKGWFTFEGLGNNGAFLKGANKKRSTLMLVEGFKDGINANIALPQCDILVNDSKNSKYNFDYLNIDDYKTIILFQDKRVMEKNKDLISQFSNIYGKDRSFFKKTKYIDYNKLNENVKDVTDFIQSLNLTLKGTKRETLRNIKKNLSSETIKQMENDIEVQDKINPLLENAKKFDNIKLFKELIKRKLLLNSDIKEDIKYYVERKVAPPATATTINLVTSKYLTEVSSDIIEQFKKHNKILLGSPTGTGKSYFTKESLTKHYKNMIIIAPLKKVAQELGQDKQGKITHIENNEKLEAVLANINAPYLSITTDTFYNLLNNKKYSDVMEERLKECELIIFDEQHIVEQSQNFRGKVVAISDYLEKKYNGKVLMMSGTPIYSALPQFHAIQAKLNDRYISTINYHTDPFKDEKELIQHIKEELKKGNILLYSKSKKNAFYINNFLKENNINSLLVTSQGNEYQGNKIEDNQIDNIEENIAIVSTTRATTGVNFKNLSTIYQFGSAYDTNTFIQLMARIRGNGNYYFIKLQGDKAQDEAVQNKSIRILNIVKELNLKTLSELFQHNKDYIQKYIELPFKSYDIKSFLLLYKNALQLIESEELGKLTEDRGDFEFSQRILEIEEKTFDKIFTNGDSINFTKYIEREMIDFLQRKSNIEILNQAYNLSFKIIHQNQNINYDDIESKALITNEDVAEKEAKKEEKKEKLDEFKKAILNKFDWLLNPKNEKDFFKEFGNSELSKLLLDKRLDDTEIQDKILKLQKAPAMITAIKFFTIDRKTIIKKAYEAITLNEYVTINELSDKLEQEILLTAKTAKNPFSKFIKDFLENDEFSKENLEIKMIKKTIEGKKKQIKNAIVLPATILKELKAIKDKAQREQKRLEYIEEMKNKELKKYEKKYNCEIVYEDAEPTINDLEKELKIELK